MLRCGLGSHGCHQLKPLRLTCPPNDRPVNFVSTVAEQKAHNIHVKDSISESEFVAMRTQRDATLEMPVLMLPAVQINIRAGELPPKEDNGISYAKIPLNCL